MSFATLLFYAVASFFLGVIANATTSFRNQGDCVSYYATGEKNLAY